MFLSRRKLIAAAATTPLSSMLFVAAAQSKTAVVASFTILADFAKTVGGDRISLTTIVGPDRDAHAYQPTPTDARALAAARVLIFNGLGFEPWADRLARSSAFAGHRIVASEGLAAPLARSEPAAKGHGHGHAHAASDPHVWQDVAGARHQVGAIATGLAAADPANATYYRERAAAYDRRLADLDAWIRDQIATVPAAKRKVITGHDAFGYFARAHGVAFRAPVGLGTDRQPSARDVAALIRQIRAEGIKAIFLENMSNPKLIEQIAREAGGVVGPTLHVDALSPEGGVAPTYEAMMRHNVPALVAGMRAN